MLRSGTISTKALIQRICKHLELVEELVKTNRSGGRDVVADDLADLVDCVYEYLRISENARRAQKVNRRFHKEETYDDSPLVSER